METFEMQADSVAAAGGELGALATAVSAATGSGTAAAGGLATAFGVIGGDYTAEVLGALASAQAQMTRLAGFYASAGAAATQTVTAALITEAGGCAALLHTLGGSVESAL